MDLTRHAVRSLAAACALTVLVAACSDDVEPTAETVEDGDQAADDTSTTETEDGGETTTTAAEDETTTTAAEDPDEPGAGSGDGTEGDPDAVALAQRINLTLDDFDEGWEESPAEDDDGGPTIDDCFTETDVEAATVGEAETGSFSYEPNDDQVQLVTMQTVVLESEDTASAIVAELGGDAFVTCAEQLFVDSYGEGSEVTLSERPDDPPFTEESTGLVGDITLAQGDDSYSGVMDLHVLRTAEVISLVATLDIGDVGIEPLLGQVYGTIAERHATEVG